jgi:NADH:ubiquinone oxidoreductase subunit 6 (subunit J)
MAIPQVGFQKGRAIIVTPLFAIMGLIIPVLGGAIIFNEWSGQKIGVFIVNVGALLAIVIGVAILSIYNVKEPRSIKEEKEELVLHANEEQEDNPNRNE